MKMRPFKAKNHNMTIIDTPGHYNFIKNTMCGLSQVDAAVLFVSPIVGEFEAELDPKMGTHNHYALLAYTLGIKQLIVCISK
jgi:elongation factor 1-alpha